MLGGKEHSYQFFNSIAPYESMNEMGLKLESTKGPVELLVIDSVQKPAEN